MPCIPVRVKSTAAGRHLKPLSSPTFSLPILQTGPEVHSPVMTKCGWSRGLLPLGPRRRDPTASHLTSCCSFHFLRLLGRKFFPVYNPGPKALF